MDFYIDMDAMSSAIAEFDAIRTSVETQIKKAENEITSLCDQGWSGEAQTAYLWKALRLLSVQGRVLVDSITSIRNCCNNHIGTVNTLLSAGKSLDL